MAAAPPLRDRGHRTGGGEARAAAAASSRAVTSTGPRTEETAAGWRENSTGTKSQWARRGVQGGEREGEEPTGPFRASLRRKLTVASAAAAATAADRILSSAPPQGTAQARRGRPQGGKSRDGHRRAGRRAVEQHQQGLCFLPSRPGCCSPARNRSRRLRVREGGWEASAPGGRRLRRLVRHRAERDRPEVSAPRGPGPRSWRGWLGVPQGNGVSSFG